MNINMAPVFVLTVLISVLPAGIIPASQEEADLARAYLPDIKVFYKLDDRPTQGLDIGETWYRRQLIPWPGKGGHVSWKPVSTVLIPEESRAN